MNKLITASSTELPRIFNFIFVRDNISVLFCTLGLIVFVLSFIYSLEYMKKEEHKIRFYVFYALTFCVYTLVCFAGNLITFYFLFEFLTLLSFPLVIHDGTKQSKLAALKYLFFSLAGAYMVLFALYFAYSPGPSAFRMGGIMVERGLIEKMTFHPVLYLLCAVFIIFGFGVKAGLFPLHAWLPSAHPVAPSPASAVLSAAIVKIGVLGIIRGIYYLFGITVIKGTWVQTVWMSVSLVTVFMGSMLAYREDNLKKRLAYSTVSQVSYILFGLSTFNWDAYNGALLHVLAHGFAKCGLFLCAGAIMHMTGKTKVSEMRGIGKDMPVTMGCFTVLSLSLIGIPPTAGFMSKWYIAVGSLKSGVPVFDILGPVILLISALLTAGYLLVPVINAFFPGITETDDLDKGLNDSEEKSDFKQETVEASAQISGRNKEPGLMMKLPIIILALLSVVLGLFPVLPI